MKKIIFTIVLFASLFFSDLSVPVYSFDFNGASRNIISHLTDPIEVWREYTLAGDQWYLIIHYDDGSIGAFPVADN